MVLVEKKSITEKFACKIFNKKDFINNSNEKKCVLNEINILRKVKHKNLLRLKEIYEGDNFIYCVCDYYEGKDLLSYLIDEGVPSLQFTLNIIKQLLKGIQYLEI